MSARLTHAQQAERDDAVTELRRWLPPGTTVWTVTRHVARSGMSRSISPIVSGPDDGEPSDLTWLVVRAQLGQLDKTHGGVKRGGCGMDMGFDLVYSLSRVLYPDGFGCIDSPDFRCPSNDHANSDDPAWHPDGGYALIHRWL